MTSYDDWKLRGPNDDGPECDCGERDVRILDGNPICHECYLLEVDAWETLPTPSEYPEDEAAEAADMKRGRLREMG